MTKLTIRATAVALTMYGSLWASPVTFESRSLGDSGDGSTEYNSTGEHYWNGSDETGDFTINGATFPNTYTDFGSYTTWSGFSYSNITDTTTPGFGNQYSAYPGSGADGSETYTVVFGDPTLTYSTPMNFSGGKGLFVSNTTYTALDLLNGSGFSKQFGGPSGDDPDWFRLRITGSNEGSPIGFVDAYLADFRFSDNSQDYVVDDWTFVDLGTLGTVDSLSFELSSSDTGDFGMNTPAYFALDNLDAIPEPGTLITVLLGALLLFAGRRRIVKRQGGSQ
ncbi:MAG: DUF4465 domain-containing protein [Kiritimatiellae bacterium]|nr:DUF4465 domain-containing protein [Kiritimatiellia bacterium]